MIGRQTLGIAMAVIIALAGLLVALVDPTHWYLMFPTFVLGGGVFLVVGRTSTIQSPEAGKTPRRPIPVFGAPTSVFLGGWGVILVVLAVLMFLEAYFSPFGWYYVYVGVATTIIVIFIAGQWGATKSHGN